MTKKKSFISLVLAFCLIIPAMFMFTACGLSAQKLTNKEGFVVEGGGFEDGSVLEASAIDSTSEAYSQITSTISSQSYDSSKPIYVFEISVKKDGEKVQPNGKVKVSVPVEADLTGYDVLHIKNDGKVERLSVTYNNGMATFETDSFSTFVFVATEAINPIKTPGSQAEWNYAVNYWQAQNNVRVFERNSSPDDSEDMGAQIMIYQLQNNAYCEDGYFENAEESKNYKGKRSYLVKVGDTYCRYDCWDEENWYKSSDEYTKSNYENELKRNIYGCLDLENELIDFNYEKFNYDSSKNVYKYKNNENITVAFEFENGNLKKVVVTTYRTSDSMTSTRTITFGDAVVEVPTTNVIDS